MKIDLEKLGQLERKLNIEVPLEKVTEAFERVYKAVQRSADIKGFRKGKAPLNIIKSAYKDKVSSDVIQDLVIKYYNEALDLHKLDPVNNPAFNIDGIEEGKPFQFTAQFEVKPEIVVKKTEGLKVQKEKLKIDDTQVEKIIENLRKSYAEVGPVLEDRAAQSGDLATIDFEGECDGQKPPGMSANSHVVEIGSKSTIDGFEDAIIGLRIGGQTTANLKFPEEYHAKEWAGKPVAFKMTLKELKKKTLPEVNDDFAKKIGFDDVEKMKKVFLDDIQKTEERRVNEDLKNRILKSLVKENPVAVPNSLLESQKQLIIEDVRKRMTEQGFSPADFNDYVQKWDGDFSTTASYIVQSSFLISKIAEDQKLASTQEDVDNKLAEYAKQSGIELERVRAYYSDNDRSSNLRFKITEDKVMDYLISKAVIDEVDKSKIADESQS